MIIGLDHIVILVDNLSDAVSSYERLGFAVDYGGRHPAWGTENALISLSDGTYIELLAVSDPSARQGHRLWRIADGSSRKAGEYGGYALLSDDLDRDITEARQRGLRLTDPQVGHRQRPDGQIVKWQLGAAERPDLPFLIQDDTPRELRIPRLQSGLNVDARITQVTIVVGDWAAGARAYERLLGTKGAQSGDAAQFQFTVGRCRVVIESPSGTSPAARYLKIAGPGLYSVTLALHRFERVKRELSQVIRVDAGVAAFDPAAAGGVEILLTPTSGTGS